MTLDPLSLAERRDPPPAPARNAASAEADMLSFEQAAERMAALAREVRSLDLSDPDAPVPQPSPPVRRPRPATRAAAPSGPSPEPAEHRPPIAETAVLLRTQANEVDDAQRAGNTPIATRRTGAPTDQRNRLTVPLTLLVACIAAALACLAFVF